MDQSSLTYSRLFSSALVIRLVLLAYGLLQDAFFLVR